MRQALLALLTPHSQQHKLAPSASAYIAKILAAFEQEQPGASASSVAAPSSAPALSPAPQVSVVSCAPGTSLTRREQEVLRLLAAGASNQEIAQILVISLDTVKKHVSHLLGKLGPHPGGCPGTYPLAALNASKLIMRQVPVTEEDACQV